MPICTSLTALATQCGGGLNQSGLSKLYMVSFGDLLNITGTDEVYASSTNGLINNINLVTGKTFVNIGLVADTSGLASEMTFDRLTQSGSVKQTFTLVLAGMTEENRQFVESIFNHPVAILFKIKNGKYFTVGLNGDLYLDSVTAGTGVTGNELQGYTLTLSCTDNKLTRMVDNTIIADLIGA